MGTTSLVQAPTSSSNGCSRSFGASTSFVSEGRLGPGDQDAKEILVLNRAIRWTEHGLEYEAGGPRQGDRLLEGLGLAGECKSVATPGLKPLLEQLEGDKTRPRVR